ncbi:hypothetical protein GGR08_001220 [Bartonella fuyuanensis]|uniref:Uncharacterized protein n=1 Tax=Bartonella fuyuanensis TaxID=1460968 RepID=A0A840E537_9HYPH|nr:hypothetical protein [Bartonella fuyuanensis]
MKASKYNDGSNSLLHKCEDGDSQWILRYIIHEHRREMGLGVLDALRKVS